MATVEENPNIGTKRGRITKNQQAKLFAIMLECYLDDLSAPAAARKARVNPKTAYSYYNQIFEQYKEESYKDIFARHEKEHVQVIASFDKEILEATDLIEQIKAQKQLCVKKKIPIPKNIIDQEIKALKYRFSLKEKKSAYILKPTLKETSDIEFEEGGRF